MADETRTESSRELRENKEALREHMGRGARILATVAGVAAVAAAGYYFYGSKNAKRNRQIVAKWASDFKEDIVSQAEQIRNLDRESLVAIVDGVTRAYETVKNIDREELMRAAGELKKNWRRLKDELLEGRSASRGESSRAARNAGRGSSSRRTRRVRSKAENTEKETR